MKSPQHFSRIFGPGILFASTAIGVSHLVQSTRAGALYGFGLVIFVVLANVLKYPFFEFGSRYANVTGKSIIEGYAGIGRWMLLLYISITGLTLFFVTAAVGAVTAGFLSNLFQVEQWLPPLPFDAVPLVLFAFCTILLIRGSYSGLDRLIKGVGLVLVVATLVAFVLLLIKGPFTSDIPFALPTMHGTASALPFLIALMGWMPTAVDLSAWNSLWTLERIRESGYHPTLKETLLEFNIGYWISAALALVFVVFGAYLMYGVVDIPSGTVAFADALIGVYTATIGDWSYFLIAASAFSIMFGTFIAVLDGYARTAVACALALTKREASGQARNQIYTRMVAITALGGYFTILIAGNELKSLIDLATTLSFVVAPAIAAANFYLVMRNHAHPAVRPKKRMIYLAGAGLIFLSVFSIVFLLNRVGII
jgi:Mn2+/Fe2+ NRAMP family transporter